MNIDSNFFIGLLVALFIIAIGLLAFSAGRTSVFTDCDNFGKADHQEVIYECSPTIEKGKANDP